MAEPVMHVDSPEEETNGTRDRPDGKDPNGRRDISSYPVMTLPQLMEALRSLPDGTMMEVNISDRT